MSDETTTTTWSDLIAGIRRLGIAGDSMPLRRKIVPDDSKPTDSEIVALMKLRGNGSREQPRSSEIGTPVGLAWRGEAIAEADAQAAWDRFHASEPSPA